VTLSKVTTYLTDHLVRLQSGREQHAPVTVQCKAKMCMFVAAAGKSLVHLDGPETGEDRLKERLIWTGERNAYGNLKEHMFDQADPGDEMAMPGPTVGADRWKSLFKEGDDATFPQTVPFEAAPPAEAPFSRVEPQQMRLAKNAATRGVGAELPMPATAER
jgi:hypothetical protein